MANAQGMCTSFKTDLLNGLHAFGVSVARGTTAADSFMAALYLVSASITPATTAYTNAGEVSGTGYTAGGIAVGVWDTPGNGGAGTTAFTTPTNDLVYSGVTLTTAFEAVLIYNDTATGKNAVSVHQFGSQTITAGTLTLTVPANAAATALLQLA